MNQIFITKCHALSGSRSESVCIRFDSSVFLPGSTPSQLADSVVSTFWVSLYLVYFSPSSLLITQVHPVSSLSSMTGAVTVGLPASSFTKIVPSPVHSLVRGSLHRTVGPSISWENGQQVTHQKYVCLTSLCKIGSRFLHLHYHM